MKKMLLLTFLLALVLSLVSIRSEAYAFGGCESDCQKCHTLEKTEVQQILTKFKAEDAKILDIKMSPVKGLWEISLEDKGNKGVMYISFSKKYIIGGSIFEIDTALNKTQETLSTAAQPADRYVDTSKIPLDGTILMGDKDARYKVIVFTDPDCPFCLKLHSEIKKILSEKKDIAFYLKLMPLKFHPDAYWKAESILCSKEPIRLLEENFEKKTIPKPDCDTKLPDENIKLGEELGITGTPTMIMPDGLVVVGLRDSGTIEELVLNPHKKEMPK
jgi:thiol:disulfide interchange protein DsbC